MSSLSVVVLLFSLLGVAVQLVDRTHEREAVGTDVVKAVIARIQPIFGDDSQFVRRVAFVVSRDGSNANTFRQGYYGGIWQVDEQIFNTTKNTTGYPALTDAYQRLNEFGLDWSSVQWRDLRIPLFSAIAVRLFVITIGAPIPCSVAEQAEYWMMHFNRDRAVESFAEAVRTLWMMTGEREAIGANVVRAVVEEINTAFGSDSHFLRRIAFVESRDGTDLNTYRTGYHGGIWQVDERGFLQTQNSFRFGKEHQTIQKTFGINWRSVQWMDLRVPFYSGLAARLSLNAGPQPLPCTIAKQAIFWMKYYNTAYYNELRNEFNFVRNQNGTIEQFIKDATRLRDMEGCRETQSCYNI